MRKINEECGVFGIIGSTVQPAAHFTATALLALQHRGQESCGVAYPVATENGETIYVTKDLGLVAEVFTPEVLASLPQSRLACGHVRYSTLRDSTIENTQPIITHHSKLNFAICYNGNIMNADALSKKMINEGKIFYSTNDTEIISKLIIEKMLTGLELEQAVLSIMDIIQGAYSLVIMTKEKLVACRDPNGFRPLCLGKMGTSMAVASETCALDSIGATFIRDIKPGEVISFDLSGDEIKLQKPHSKLNLCIFEFVYTARSDSFIEGISVYQARVDMGKALARQAPTDADLVCGVPESGNDAAHGYSMQSGIPFGLAFIRNRYVQRSFIMPTQAGRSRAVGLKLNALKASVKGKRIILVDDSIVRGTTSEKIIKMLRKAGAKEVHLRISSPPFIAPCYFGTDIDNRDKLIAVKYSVEQIRKQIGADSLVFLDIDEIARIGGKNIDYCKGCFSEKYPIEINDICEKDEFDNDNLNN